MKRGFVLIFWVGLLVMAVMYGIKQLRYHEHRVSRQELQVNVDKTFADRARMIEGKAGRLSYEIPRVAIIGDRAHVIVDFSGEAKELANLPVRGVLEFDTQVRYDADTQSVRLVEPQLVEVDIGGLKAFGLSSLGHVIGSMFASVLDDMSVYSLDDAAKAKLPPFVSVHGIEFDDGELVIRLKLG